MQAVDSETITVSTSAIGLTVAKLAASESIDHVTIYAEDLLRFWTSGKVPTSTQGVPMTNDTERTFNRNEALKLKMIRVGGSDVLVQVQYYRL